MGNTASDVTSGVKKQAEADSSSQKLYQLVDLKGLQLIFPSRKLQT